ncbi:MAG TPA: excinuclease ABC subunit UvrC, partial [Candidatus Saccharimonadales bacterium]
MSVTDEIKHKLKKLPTKSGVYFHKNKAGQVIYVGKAAVLKNRVRQYFQQSRNRDPKTEALVAEIVDIDWIETESEIDALFLEAELIKRYKPRYNIELRDDKSDLFVRIDIKSAHPTVQYTRRPLDDGAEYYGPFTSPYGVRRAMKYLRRIFPYDMKKLLNKSRVSLDYHIGLSPGLEENKTTLDQYRYNLRQLIKYITGRRVALLKDIEKDMKQAANRKDFEAAANYRNQLSALKALRQQVIFGDREFMDISKDKGLNGLKKLLNLDSEPKRIEGYDISHMSGQDTVASLVVFTRGIPDKSQYRKFKLRLPGNDDFAHMREVISRRFSGRHENWPKPDLLLVDGGKGQLSSALSAMAERGLSIPAIGLAKRHEQIVRVSGGRFELIKLDAQSDIIKLLQRVRDESHRFAISYHSTVKTKRQTASLLEGIPTVGVATRKKLIKEFGSIRGVIQAREWELARTVGTSKARLIKQYLRST